MGAHLDDLTALYFFSTSCPHCKAVEPAIEGISKEFKVQGLFYGKGVPGPMPFNIRKGDQATSARYGLEGVPALVVLKNGSVRHIFRGEYDIRDARSFLRGFRKGALTVTEATAQGTQKEVMIVGWVRSRGDYFKEKLFFFTDHKESILIKPWLPLEAIKSPFKRTRPRLMSDVIDKPVALKGDLLKTGKTYQFTVKEEINLDEK